MKMGELKPCPFCGGEAELRDGHIYMDDTKIVTCKKCHARTLPVTIDHPSFTVNGLDESTRYTPEQAEQIACDKWNKRVNDCDWISVHDALPGTDEKVVFITKCNRLVFTGWLEAVGPQNAVYFSHKENGRRKMVYSATHWLRMPKLPKEE